ncbi:MAG: hypothetical protein LBH95_05760 [Oscillospiraceae bacterium]|jgi:hypothetical protein|nr:hypothetical protein [Oscillospiraceae bacterium]
MSRHKITLLSVAAALLLAVVLMGSVWFIYFTGRPADFTLPPPLPPDASPGVSGPGPVSGGTSYIPLAVDARNIRTLLATVERPGAYRQTIVCTSYWPGGEESVTHLWARRGGLTRVETLDEGHPSQNRIVTPDVTYVWTGDAMPSHTVSPEDADAEALSGVPTWEDVAALPQESIVSAEYLYLPEEGRCLRVWTREAVYQGEYIVSLETGLLVRAAFTGADGQAAYACDAQAPDLGDPGDLYFTLPDGKLVSG